MLIINTVEIFEYVIIEATLTIVVARSIFNTSNFYRNVFNRIVQEKFRIISNVSTLFAFFREEAHLLHNLIVYSQNQ